MVIGTTMPAGTWTHVAVMDAVTGGNVLFHGPLSTTRVTSVGQTVTFLAGGIDVGFSAACNATDYLRGKIIDRFLRNQAWTPPTVHVGAYTSATSRTGGGTELVTAPYTRVVLPLVAPSGGVTSNSANVIVPVPAATVTHMAVLDAITAGNMLLESALTGGSQVTASGDVLRFLTGAYDLVVT